MRQFYCQEDCGWNRKNVPDTDPVPERCPSCDAGVRLDAAKTYQGAIVGTPKGKIDEKRVRLPDVVLTSECPQCKKIVKRDFGQDGLDYPVMNKPFDFGLCCEDCDREWSVKVILSVGLSFA